jgi:hypothetical protein
VGQLVEVLSVAMEELPAEGPLLGANVDSPNAERRVAAAAVEIDGWALGRGGAPDLVEVAIGGRVLARAPARRPRADISEAFPQAAGAARAGFELVLDASAAPPRALAEVRARFGPDTAPIASLGLRRCWRGEPAPGESPLVSVLLACEDADRLRATLASVDTQRYWPTELLVLRPEEAAEAAFTLRNDGIRRSNGDLLLFVEAGSLLAADALRWSVEMLGRHSEAAGLVDSRPGGGVAAAVYRRAAFEELGGFVADERSCDAELARRAAAAYDVLFEPGALVAGADR